MGLCIHTNEFLSYSMSYLDLKLKQIFAINSTKPEKISSYCKRKFLVFKFGAWMAVADAENPINLPFSSSSSHPAALKLGREFRQGQKCERSLNHTETHSPQRVRMPD